MNTPVTLDYLTKAILFSLRETVEDGDGAYLDTGTSLFETLATISAAEASLPVGKTCATLAAQVDHTRFYIDVMLGRMSRTNTGPADWDDIWDNVAAVTPDEWSAIIQRLRASYDALVDYLSQPTVWQNDDNLDGALAILAHTAYHLGEIRQALCTLR
ncbi:MAG: DinB family protein [Anaerolineae bacterium]|jgi:hypothetical protein|nr:DinB family protein [Anaerolineae bacterium]